MTPAEISIVVAMDEQRGIGKNGRLPWPRIPEDMRRFRDLTIGHPVIMGRKTWDSLDERYKPLPQRLNIIVTRNDGLVTEGAKIARSLEAAITMAQLVKEREIFIIGGGQIYEGALPLVNKLHLTIVRGDFGADTFFPDYSDFDRIVEEIEGQSDQFRYKFLILEKSEKRLLIEACKED